NEQGLLLGEWVDWRRYREMRSRTSRAYNEDAALEVVEGIPRFLEEATYLHKQLQERLL
ncbi:MAG: nucleotidyltransferase, partial [Gammaproteobacteria bacterium]|nr:nucleotidyltransferase [Gammaproteobacteria bacterium]